MTRTGWLLILLVALATVGCARGGWISETMTLVDVTGTWNGTVYMRGGNCFGGGCERTLRADLMQRGAAVTGNVEGKIFTQLGGGGSGPVEGMVTGEVLSFKLPFHGAVTVVGDDMSGPLEGLPNCPCDIVLHRGAAPVK